MFTLLAAVSFLLSFITHSEATSSCANLSALVPLLRSFNGQNHFYTTNSTENNNFIAQAEYSYQGISAFIWSMQLPSTVPLYRLFNENKNDHFYTMSSDELPEMINQGWTYDGTPNHIAGYVYPYSICGASPIYRLFNSTAVDHFYTMDPNEAASSGYEDQGIAGYAILPSAGGAAVASPTAYILPTAVSATDAAQASTSSCANPANATPFLRAYSGIGTDHFYTTNATEMNVVAIAQDSYSFEGDATFLWTSQEGSTVPLYRLWSQSQSDHFYTIDSNEVNEALAAGYAFDTAHNHIAGYVYPYSECGSSPIYRLFSSDLTDHFYTMSYTESQQATGYIIEGVAGFALLPSTDGQPQTATLSASPLFLPAESASATAVALMLPSRVSGTSHGSSTNVGASATSDASHGSSTDVGAIAGGTVGGVVGLIALVLILYFVQRRIKTPHHTHSIFPFVAELKSSSTDDPYQHQHYSSYGPGWSQGGEIMQYTDSGVRLPSTSNVGEVDDRPPMYTEI